MSEKLRNIYRRTESNNYIISKRKILSTPCVSVVEARVYFIYIIIHIFPHLITCKFLFVHDDDDSLEKAPPMLLLYMFLFH